jgi:hypothetical protein
MNADVNSKNIFRRQKKLVRQYALSAINKSQEYQGFENQLDVILLLADRVLVAFEEHVEFNRIGEVAKTLEQVGQASENGEPGLNDVTSLLQSLEQWLKALIWLVDRPNWNQLNSNKKRFTLFPCIRELGLLTQQELDTPEDQDQTITDEVRRLIYWSHKDRNFITHETSDAPHYIRSRYLPSALLTLLAPIYKHQDTIKQNLSGLIASPTVKVQEVENLIRLIDGERRNHLHRFRGRQKWITQLGERLLADSQSQKPYLLLTGHEGLGKSALCAKLTEELVHHNIDFLGANVTEIRKIAPWLPNILLHFGKQSNQPDEIIHLLVAQANTLLLDSIELSHSDQHWLQDVDARFNPTFEDEPISAQVAANRLSYPDYRAIQTPRFRPKAIIPDIEQYRRTLYLVLEKVAREYGPIIVIIDAVDEISPDGTNLNFLPEYLPQGVSALLTARQNTQVVSWLADNRNIDRVRLMGLEKEEIPLLTGIKDTDGADQAEFNERVWKASQGWPVLIQAATKLIPEHQNDLSKIKVAQSADSVFERQAREWEQASYHLTDSDVLLSLLRTLAIFEPAAHWI